MTRGSSGYSGKPLFQKLGLKPGTTCLTLWAPEHLSDLMTGVEDVRFVRRATPAEVVLAFCRRKRDVSKAFERAKAAVKPGGMIWVGWPKKRSPLFKDLTEQDFRDHILPLGWVDVKVCAIDEDWSGLKFLKRKANPSDPLG